MVFLLFSSSLTDEVIASLCAPVFLLFKEKCIVHHVYACVSVSEYVHMSAVAHGGQKRVPDSLEFKSQVVVSHPTWVLGTELQSSAKAALTLNH